MLIENLKWRHAVKSYDPNRKVSSEDIDKITEAVRLAPTSSGLQQFRVIVVENQQIKEKLVEGALNPECMRNCSHLLVFAAWNTYTEERIDKMYDYITDERNLPRGRFSNYTNRLKDKYLNNSEEENFQHTARQSYIGLAFALAQAAELKIATTPVEGFDNQLVDKVLNLKKYGLKSVSLMYIGYADTQKDWLATMKKVRVPKEEFVIKIS